MRQLDRAEEWMERYVRAELGLTRDEDDPEVIEDLPLFHALPYVIQTWTAKKQHGTLPESGGWNDQSASWAHDCGQMDRLYAVTLDRLLPELKDRHPQSEDNMTPTETWEDLRDG